MAHIPDDASIAFSEHTLAPSVSNTSTLRPIQPFLHRRNWLARHLSTKETLVSKLEELGYPHFIAVTSAEKHSNPARASHLAYHLTHLSEGDKADSTCPVCLEEVQKEAKAAEKEERERREKEEREADKQAEKAWDARMNAHHKYVNDTRATMKKIDKRRKAAGLTTYHGDEAYDPFDPEGLYAKRIRQSTFGLSGIGAVFGAGS